VSICDRCACDISTAPDLHNQPVGRDLRVHIEEVIAQERVTAPPPEPVAAEPPAPVVRVAEAPPARRNPLAVVGRLLLAATAVTVGVAGGLALVTGSALEADPHLAGSIAILAAAASICGLVLVLVGSSPDRSTGVTIGLRTAGFLLAAMGVWAVTVISHGAITGGARPEASVDQPPPVITTGPMMGMPGGMPGPGMGGEGSMMEGSGPMGPPGMAPMEGSGPPPVGGRPKAAGTAERD
jgi:hypothetical protein